MCDPDENQNEAMSNEWDDEDCCDHEDDFDDYFIWELFDD